MTPEESEVVARLAEAWNLFVRLPTIHPSDQAEFAHAIHQAQNIVLARPVLRVHYGGKELDKIGSEELGAPE